jgi:hypothetical protein
MPAEGCAAPGILLKSEEILRSGQKKHTEDAA